MSYTYKFLLDENGQVVYPRTVLSAVDVITANGIQISGDTMSVVFASKEQIHQGAAGMVISAEGLKEAISAYSDTLYIAGGGIDIKGGTVFAKPAPVNSLIMGTPNEYDSVTNGNLNGALDVGKAVDVTGTPNNGGGFTVTTYTEATTENGETTEDTCIQLTRSSAPASKLWYWYSASSMGYSTGKTFLFIGDFKNVGAACSIKNEPHDYSGVNIPGVLSRISMTANEGRWHRLAILHSSSYNNIGGEILPDAASTNIDVRIKHYLVFDVTGLSDEAIYALATMEHPERVYNRYLVKKDEVCPWVEIRNLSTASTATIQAGLAYKLQANDGNTHTLTVDTLPADSYGRDAYITIFLDDASYVVATKPLVIVDPLMPNAANNCVVKFRDGYARLYVTDTDYGFAVTVTSGTDSDSLYYGLYKTTENYIQFAHSTDETDCVVISGSSVVPQTTASTRTIVGNGVDKTVANFNNGTLKVTKSLTVTNATLKNVNINSGTVYAAYASLNNVTLSGGKLQLNDNVTITGSFTRTGGTISLGINSLNFNNCSAALGNTALFISDSSVSIISSSVSGGSTSGSGGAFRISGASGRGSITDSLLTGNTATNANSSYGGAIYVTTGATTSIIDSSLSFNYSARSGGALLVDTVGSYVTCTDCIIKGNTANSTGGGGLYVYNGASLKIERCEVDGNTAGNYGGGLMIMTGTSTLTVIDCVISGNRATVGGGIGTSGGVVTVEGSTIASNVSITTGGGINATGTVSVSDCLITGNTATTLGGGIHSNSASTTLNVSGSTISGNISPTGAALYLAQANSTFIIEDTLIINNIAATRGVIYHASGTLTISNSIISNNYTAIEMIEQRGGTITLNNVLIVGNTANGDVGSAIYSTGSGVKTYINGCTIRDNLNIRDGYNMGTCYNSTSALMVFNDTIITGNTVSPNHKGEVAGINGGTMSFSNCVLDGGIDIPSTGFGRLEFAEHTRFTGHITGNNMNYLLVYIKSGSTVNLSSNPYTDAISGSTISAEGNFTVIDTFGNSKKFSARSITGSTITNTGLWLPNPGRQVLTGTVDFMGYTLENIIYNDHGAAINASGAGTKNIEDITIIGCTTTQYGCIYSQTAGNEVNITNCTISYSRCGYGTIMAGTSSVVTVTHCVLHDNISSSFGSAGQSWNAGTLKLIDCDIYGNSSGSTGTVMINNGKWLYVEGCYFHDNIGSYPGVYASGSTTTITGCTFGQKQNITISGASTILELKGTNILQEIGAASSVIKIDDGSVLDLRGNTVGNSIRGGTISAAGSITIIDRYGGYHIYLARSVTGSTITNTGYWLPSPRIVSANSGVITIQGNLITDNTVSSSDAGGGVSVTAGTVNISASTISNNKTTSSSYTAGLGGGCAVIGSDSKLFLTNCRITGNSSFSGGGLWAYSNSSLTAYACTISNNTSPQHGAAVRCSYSAIINLTNCYITNNINTASDNSAVIAVDSGTISLTGCTISGNTGTYGLFATRQGVFIISGGTYSDPVRSDYQLTLMGTTRIMSTVTSTGLIIIASGAKLDFNGNTDNANVITGSTITAQGAFTVVDKNNVSHSFSAGTKNNSKITNTGTWT